MIARTLALTGLLAVTAIAFGGATEEFGLEDPFVEDAAACEGGKCGCSFDPTQAHIDEDGVDIGLTCYS